MLSVIWFLIIGLVIGAIARLLVPGRDPMGWIATLVLGVVGSYVGGIIGAILTPGRRILDLQPAGFIGSVVGAIIVLVVYRQLQKSRRVGGATPPA